MIRARATLSLTVVVLALSACSGGAEESKPDAAASPTPEPSALEQAYDVCADEKVGNPLLDDSDKATASDLMQVDEKSLVIDGYGDQFASGQTVNCVLDELAVTTAVRSMIESTTSLMGRQTAEWGEFEATWSFHPDNGIDMVIEETS